MKKIPDSKPLISLNKIFSKSFTYIDLAISLSIIIITVYPMFYYIKTSADVVTRAQNNFKISLLADNTVRLYRNNYFNRTDLDKIIFYYDMDKNEYILNTNVKINKHTVYGSVAEIITKKNNKYYILEIKYGNYVKKIIFSK